MWYLAVPPGLLHSIFNWHFNGNNVCVNIVFNFSFDWYKNNRKDNLRREAVPAVTFKRAVIEYCCRALARCTAAESKADILRTFPIQFQRYVQWKSKKIHYMSWWELLSVESTSETWNSYRGYPDMHFSSSNSYDRFQIYENSFF